MTDNLPTYLQNQLRRQQLSNDYNKQGNGTLFGMQTTRQRNIYTKRKEIVTSRTKNNSSVGHLAPQGVDRAYLVVEMTSPQRERARPRRAEQLQRLDQELGEFPRPTEADTDMTRHATDARR